VFLAASDVVEVEVFEVRLSDCRPPPPVAMLLSTLKSILRMTVKLYTYRGESCEVYNIGLLCWKRNSVTVDSVAEELSHPIVRFEDAS